MVDTEFVCRRYARNVYNITFVRPWWILYFVAIIWDNLCVKNVSSCFVEMGFFVLEIEWCDMLVTKMQRLREAAENSEVYRSETSLYAYWMKNGFTSSVSRWTIQITLLLISVHFAVRKNMLLLCTEKICSICISKKSTTWFSEFDALYDISKLVICMSCKTVLYKFCKRSSQIKVKPIDFLWWSEADT